MDTQIHFGMRFVRGSSSFGSLISMKISIWGSDFEQKKLFCSDFKNISFVILNFRAKIEAVDKLGQDLQVTN